MLVEYPFALPPQISAQGSAGGGSRGLCGGGGGRTRLAGLEGRAAAGRVRQPVATERVRTPREFHAAVASLTGEVRLQVTAGREGAAVRVVTAE